MWACFQYNTVCDSETPNYPTTRIFLSRDLILFFMKEVKIEDEVEIWFFLTKNLFYKIQKTF